MSALKVDRILVLLKAKIDRDVSSHCWQNFGSSERNSCQLRHLTRKITPSRIKVALKATLLALIVDRRHSIFQEYQLLKLTKFWQPWKLRSTGMSSPTVDRILVSMKARINRNVNSHCWQDFWELQKTTLSTPIVDGKHSVFQVLGSSESYGNVSS